MPAGINDRPLALLSAFHDRCPDSSGRVGSAFCCFRRPWEGLKALFRVLQDVCWAMPACVCGALVLLSRLGLGAVGVDIKSGERNAIATTVGQNFGYTPP